MANTSTYTFTCSEGVFLYTEILPGTALPHRSESLVLSTLVVTEVGDGHLIEVRGLDSVTLEPVLIVFSDKQTYSNVTVPSSSPTETITLDCGSVIELSEEYKALLDDLQACAASAGSGGGNVLASTLPVELDLESGRKYGEWGVPITDVALSIDIDGASELGFAIVYYQGSDPLGPIFVLPNGGEIVKDGYTFVADQVNRLIIQYHDTDKVTVATAGGVLDIDSTAPLFVDAAVEDAAPTFIDANFNERVYGTSLEAWDIVVDAGSPVKPVSIDQNGTTQLRFELATPLTAGQSVTIEHTESGSDFQDSVGNPLGDVAPTAVTNNIAGAFTPASLPDQILWLDPDDDATVTTVDDGGEEVFTQITDKFQAIDIDQWPGFDAARPVRGTLEGKRCFENRASGFMDMRLAHAAANAISAGSGLTIAFRILATDTATAGILSKGNSQSDAQFTFFENFNGALATEIQETALAVGNRMDSGASDFFDAAAVTAGVAKTVVFTMSPGGVKTLRINGVQVATESGSPIVANTGNWYFFTDIAGQPFEGKVGEIIITGSQITGGTVTDLEDYLTP